MNNTRYCERCDNYIDEELFDEHVCRDFETASNMDIDVVDEFIINHFQQFLNDHSMFAWTRLPSLQLITYQDPNQNFVIEDNYEFNSALGERIGKVERGLNDTQIEQVSEMIENTQEERCPICLEDLIDKMIRRLHCTHVYCDPCIRRWLSKSKRCPCCKTHLEDIFLNKN